MNDVADPSTSHTHGSAAAEAQDELQSQADQQDQSAQQGSGWLSRNGFRIGPIALSVLSAALLIDAFSSGLGQISNPGPGLWPAITSATALTCSVVSIFLPNAGAQKFTRGGSVKVGIFILLLQLFAVLVEPIGFIIPSVVVVFGLLYFIAREKLLLSAIMAISLSLVTFLIFGELLSVRVSAF